MGSQNLATVRPDLNQFAEEQKEANSHHQQPGSQEKTELLTFANVLMGALCIGYFYLFWNSVREYWFHPHWTTDDALQQIFPFHEILNPGIFQGDLIYDLVRGYLAPLHYGICALVTWATGDPIMMGHWVMLIQLALTVSFLFLAVSHVAGIAPALFSVIWLIHTRPVVQRLTGGLPRGWGAVIFAAFLCFVFRKNHRAVLITLLAGCLLHPPATLLAAVVYGLYLTLGVVRKKTQQEFLKPFLLLVVLSPVYLGVTYSVVKRPDYIGQMVSSSQAAEMPEFQYPDGRFPFLPLRKPGHEIRSYGFQAFSTRLYGASRFVKRHMWEWVSVLGGLMILGALWRKRKIVPEVLFVYLASVFLVYFASRYFAFRLYVPNRHLQFPMVFFAIPFFTIGIWKLLYRGDADQPQKNLYVRSTVLSKSWLSLFGLVGVSALIYLGSGLGLNGTANFNYAFNKKGHIYSWVRENAPENALFAGHPTFIDAMQLFGMRRAYATTETAHPFYPTYYNAIKKRLEISLRAHYASSLNELLEIVEPEGIDYFVFERKRFYPEALEKAEYHPPLDTLVEELTSRYYMNYAYREIPRDLGSDIAPYQVFRDSQSVVIDIQKLKQFLLQ